jgi:DNA adenine methylase
MRIVPAALPVAPYIGGKRNLAKRIVERIEAIPHTTYAEPFVGMAGVFLRRNLAAPAEVVNDANRDVATFFRILQRHYVAFMEMMRFQITTRAEFERLSGTDPETLTDLERSARFLYLQKTAFGGKVAARTFGVSPGNPGRFDITKLGPMLDALHSRLAGVVIECLPFADFIRRYDRPETLFYLDPPYWGCENDYGAGLFGREDFEVLADLLNTIQGRFIMSLNDRSEVREMFAAFSIEAVETTYSIGRAAGARSRVGEVIISGP